MTPEPITFLILDVAKAVRRRFDAALGRLGLDITAGEARTLLHAARTPGLRQTALAEQMDIEPMTLVGFLDRLEKAGLIARTPEPGDRRAKLIAPTRTARPLIDRIEVIAQQVRREAMETLTSRQADAMRESLAAMRAHLTGDPRTKRA